MERDGDGGDIVLYTGNTTPPFRKGGVGVWEDPNNYVGLRMWANHHVQKSFSFSKTNSLQLNSINSLVYLRY